MTKNKSRQYLKKLPMQNCFINLVTTDSIVAFYIFLSTKLVKTPQMIKNCQGVQSKSVIKKINSARQKIRQNAVVKKNK